MKKLAFYCFILIVFTLSLFGVHCTGNPIDNGDISSGRSQMIGKVQLENAHSPEGVYVWMEGFDLSAFTTEDGSFTLTWPSGFSKVSGIFSVYFFVANYQLDSVDVAVREGEFLYGQEGLNTSGELRQPVRLRQFLAVSADVSPETITRVNDLDVTMTFSLGLRTLTGVSTVVLPNTTPGFLSSVFFKNTETGELFIFKGLPVTTEEEILVGQTQIVREMNVVFTRINLPPGKYLCIPYILVKRDDLPENLVNSIALNTLAFGPNYLKLPFMREAGIRSRKEPHE